MDCKISLMTLEWKKVIINNAEIPDSPVESYLCNLPLMRSDKQPPSLPAQLQKVLLNSKSITQDDPYILPVPNHVSLNHLYACSIRDGVMAISSTSRYRKKVTVY